MRARRVLLLGCSNPQRLRISGARRERLENYQILVISHLSPHRARGWFPEPAWAWLPGGSCHPCRQFVLAFQLVHLDQLKPVLRRASIAHYRVSNDTLIMERVMGHETGYFDVFGER